jgi:fructokinase
MTYIAGIEAGGTKFLVSLGTTEGRIIAHHKIPTTTPQEVMPQVIACLQAFYQQHAFAAVGIGCFGPIDPNSASPTYGQITTTPKLAWQHYDIVSAIKQHFTLPIGFDTDVNGAALGEYRWGQAQGLSSVVYITVGTGIGVGVVVDGKPLHGAMHPEAGHLLVAQLPEDDFAGVCPFHNNCLEGLACGPALLQRVGASSANDIAPEHPVWQLEAHYLACAVSNYILTLSPQRIIFGGGVMQQPGLIEQVRQRTLTLLAGYIDNAMTKNIDNTVTYASSGQHTGMLGALALAAHSLSVS